MRLPWRRPRVRTCIRCGYEWQVPYALAKRRRPGKWAVGVSAADHLGAPRGGEHVAAHYNLEMAKQRAEKAWDEASVRETFGACANCGSEAWLERKA